jgi:hypothetical protein
MMQTTIVKISLLLQFLRIFKAGTMRWICIIEITVVALWGLAFFIIGWFPCFPVRGAWERDIGATCYGFGLGDVQEFILMFKFHSASNMVLDFAVFLTPMVIFRSPNLKTKNVLGIIGVFGFGATYVIPYTLTDYLILAKFNLLTYMKCRGDLGLASDCHQRKPSSYAPIHRLHVVRASHDRPLMP